MSALLVRRRFTCAYEAGPRAVSPLLPAIGPATRAAYPVTAYCAAVTEDKVAALTYDDGPDPRHTPGVLDALADAGTKATFLLLLDQAERHPALVRRIVAGGHEVGLHGADHRRVSTQALGPFVRDVRAARRRLSELTGQPVRWYRPAYGAIRLSQQIATHALGLDVPVWTAWARDWEDADVALLADRATAALHPGAVLLLHDAASGLAADDVGTIAEPRFDRADLTRRILAAATEDGYRLMNLGDLARDYPQARVPWFESRATARSAAGRLGG